MRKLIRMDSVGESRVRRRFLFFPKTLAIGKGSDLREYRWLEWASWCQEAMRWHDGLAPYLQWVDRYWIGEADA